MATPLDQQPVTALKGVGPGLAKKLSQLGIASVQDLLFHLPLRYQDRTRITPIGAAQPGVEAVIEGTIRGADVVFGRRRSLLCRLQDNTGTITLRFFHFSKAQQAGLKTGDTLRCFGEVRRGSAGLELVHPEYRHTTTAMLADDGRLTPIYPTTAGFTQQRWRMLTEQALARLDHGLGQSLPDALLPDALRVSLADALHFLHRPPRGVDLKQLAEGVHPFQQRLAFEELLSHNLSLRRLRARLQQHSAPAMKAPGQLSQQLLQRLPFTLTGAQQRAVHDIVTDLAKAQPMLRLVQGDVGSGKTVVAAMAAAHVIGHGYQTALMAPTEVLATQHANALSQWLQPLGVRMALLTSQTPKKQKAEILAGLQDGDIQLAIGTHALFQESVCFHRLGLAIIDEQHRFGVHQRLALSEKGQSEGARAHQLIMTATPIPRTLAMSAYADLDNTIIDELPPGRTPIQTVLVDNSRRDEVIERVHKACREGRQAYWVCTLIEESEELDCEAAEATHAALSTALPDVRVGLIHGRLKPADKNAVMTAFKHGELDLLVATTVIEVGVDVPNASLMIIENPERLGLAQLHQLRGRVGRGSAESHCVLLYAKPLSHYAKERLATMRETNDGFVIAEKDLELRGPGELLGARQAGLVQFRIADLQRDAALLEPARHAAETVLQQHAALAETLIARWLPDGERLAGA
ncbi:MAG: ATP-dependent DNA helicase RecG [Gammaproteobacteria bacterium]|nr:MAG: ATP-dependent DNA helicase RecG [Gammaproteobacteria bacterium]